MKKLKNGEEQFEFYRSKINVLLFQVIEIICVERLSGYYHFQKMKMFKK
ncbi:MAG: hypothetical protein ACFB0A_06240 [Croceivirga sp.]